MNIAAENPRDELSGVELFSVLKEWESKSSRFTSRGRVRVVDYTVQCMPDGRGVLTVTLGGKFKGHRVHRLEFEPLAFRKLREAFSLPQPVRRAR